MGYDLPRYGTRKRIARVEADDLVIAELKRLLMMRLYEAQRAGNTHLFLFLFEEFLHRTKVLGKSPAGDAPPSATLRTVLLAEYLRDLASQAEALHSKAASLKRELGTGRPLTIKQRSARDTRRMKLLKKAASLEVEVDSAAATDSVLLGYFRRRKMVSLPFEQSALYRPGVDLNERIPGPAKSVLEGYWESVFSAITTGNPEPDDLEWDDVASDFQPKLVAEVGEGKVSLRVVSDEKLLCDKLLYLNGDRLPLRREDFGPARKSEDGFICTVSFHGQRKRYVQFVCIDVDGDCHRSPLYEIDPAGRIDRILPGSGSRGGHAESGDSLQKDAASKTASKRVTKGTSKPKRAR